ncbi:methyl-accepting chemotaxis protein [Allorhizobium undicola]
MVMFGSVRDAMAETEALRRSQAVIEFALDGTILNANETFCNVIGYSLAELKGHHHSMLVDPDYAGSADYKTFWNDLRAGHFQRSQFMRKGKGGRDVWIEASYNPVFRGGKPYKIVKYAVDITENVLRSRENEAWLAAISRSQAVIEFRPDGTILTANENFCKATGYRLDEIVGRHHRMFCDATYASSPDYAQFWRRLAAGEFLADEFRRLTKDGRDLWIQASYNPILDTNGTVVKVVKFATDVTSRMVAIDQLGRSISALEHGDLTQTLNQPFVPTMEALRKNFNLALAKLNDTLANVSDSACSISSNTREIASAAADLAQRTEQQAASIEEAAAALEEVTTTVREAAKRTQNMGKLVEQTRDNAEKSGEVVSNTVAAMDEIEQSSRKISTILGVIDEIAFQTNLLALNAGVEAARAGEAGKGFAVVAQEVRELAQRSGNAAKEIRGLISTSTSQVERGVHLVAATGEALDKIVNDVVELSANVAALVQGTQEQSGALGEITSSINLIDQGTQRNAAMVEETTAATHALSQEAEGLFQLVGTFTIDQAPAAPQRRAA